MENKKIIEGIVEKIIVNHDTNGNIIYGMAINYTTGDEMLEKYLNKRIKITIEIIEY